MIDLNEISKIGIGTYRMGIDNDEHMESLIYATKSGYNLIDTSSNYLQGKSEKLIGKLLENNSYLSNKLFIISKAGYVPKKNDRCTELNSSIDSGLIEIIKVDQDFEYSLDPFFLNIQLEQSLDRLNRDFIDGYLLQNPERFLEAHESKEKMYSSIEKAFKFLETKVKEGKIRYYGISSNKIFDPKKEDSIDLNKIIYIAKTIKVINHFKLIQFPFNFNEQLASSQTYEGKSFLQLAKLNKLITFSNRPLNMQDEKGLEFRFVDYHKDLWELNEDGFKKSFDYFLDAINKKIEEVSDSQNTIDDFEPMKVLKENFSNFTSLESVDNFFNSQIYPFINVLYENKIDKIIYLSETIKSQIKKKTLYNISERSNFYLKKLENKGIQKQSNLPLTAANFYINDIKIDHILMGLRKKEYVMSLKSMYTKKRK